MHKVIDWVIARFPWALRNHYHGDPTLLRYGVCSRCGHVILMGHVENHKVSIRAWGLTWGATYSKGCAPAFTHLELAPDKTVHAYIDSEEGRVETAIPAKDQDEFERLSARMLDEAAHWGKLIR